MRSLRKLSEGKERGNETNVLPILSEWKNGEGPNVLRLFLEDTGVTKHIVFHTLRACFATHLLSLGVDSSKVMRMGGWSDLKTFQIYLRLAGVDVFDILPTMDQLENVYPIFNS